MPKSLRSSPGAVYAVKPVVLACLLMLVPVVTFTRCEGLSGLMGTQGTDIADGDTGGGTGGDTGGGTGGDTGGVPTLHDLGWTKRMQITIHGSALTSPLFNYPVYIDLADLGDEFFQQVKADGGDIVITSDDEVQKLQREIVFIDTAAKKGELWFKAPVLYAVSDMVFYIYFGNPAGAEQDDTGTWNNAYGAVWHFDETSGMHEDSTINGNHSREVSVSIMGMLAGILYGVDDYDGNDYVKFPDTTFPANPDNTPFEPENLTVEAWFQFRSLPTLYSRVISKESGVYAEPYSIFIERSTARPRFCLSNTVGAETCCGATSVNLGDWVYFVGTYDNMAKQAKCYLNGQPDGVIDVDIDVGYGANEVWIGNNPTMIRRFDGYIDEVRISSVARTEQWIAASYKNINERVAFYSLGFIETL